MVPLTFAGLGLLVIQFGARHLTLHGNRIWNRCAAGPSICYWPPCCSRDFLDRRSSAWTRFLLSRPLAFLGKYSYGLYVYHHFFSYYFTSHHTDLILAARLGCTSMAALLLQAGAGIAASVVLAWLSYECFEKHFLRLKRYWPSWHARILGTSADCQASDADAAKMQQRPAAWSCESPAPSRPDRMQCIAGKEGPAADRH